MNEIRERRSIRKFDTQKPVTSEQIQQLLEAAMLAPSACNSRPWEFVVVKNRDILLKFKETLPGAKMMDTASVAIAVVAVPQSGKMEGYFPQDCGAATQNILLAAVSLGLGACWCGVYPHSEKILPVTKLLNIEPPKVPINVIAIGTPLENPPQRGFFDPKKVTFLN